MPLRTIVHDGTEWTVWDVVPSLETRLPLSERTEAGWLCFQSAAEKRRIAPAPAGWEEWSDETLAERLRQAAVVRPSGAHAADDPPGTETGTERLRRQVSESMQRAQDLGDRVRRAMDQGGALPLDRPGAQDLSETGREG